jgi:L-2-hydroxyglutarate oxidase LhgO
VPEPGGLGVHLTLDMAGAARFGPDVEWLATGDPAAIDYAVSPDLPAKFAPRIAAWWPHVTPAMLAPAYSGVRPKLAGPGQPNADFRIEGPESHGLPGLVNLFGMESPGLTASLAIADRAGSLVI